eukprot:2463635-Pleurochrysis_carterae.AAC.1
MLRTVYGPQSSTAAAQLRRAVHSVLLHSYRARLSSTFASAGNISSSVNIIAQSPAPWRASRSSASRSRRGGRRSPQPGRVVVRIGRLSYQEKTCARRSLRARLLPAFTERGSSRSRQDLLARTVRSPSNPLPLQLLADSLGH